MSRAERSDQVPPRSNAGRQRSREPHGGTQPRCERPRSARSPHRPTPPSGKVATGSRSQAIPAASPAPPAPPGTCLWRRADSPAVRTATPAAAAAAPPAPRSAAASPPRRRPSTRDAAPCAAPAGCGARRRAGRREGACRRSLIRPRGQHRGGSGSRPGTAATSRGGEASIFMSGAGGARLGRRGTAPPPRPTLRRAGRGCARAWGARAPARGRGGLAHLRALPGGGGASADGGEDSRQRESPGTRGAARVALAIRRTRGRPLPARLSPCRCPSPCVVHHSSGKRARQEAQLMHGCSSRGCLLLRLTDGSRPTMLCQRQEPY